MAHFVAVVAISAISSGMIISHAIRYAMLFLPNSSMAILSPESVSSSALLYIMEIPLQLIALLNVHKTTG